jgi:F0F1-type ATP synthase assembly protein I
VAVKVGFGSAVPRKFTCKDFVAMLIERVLNSLLGSNESLWIMVFNYKKNRAWAENLSIVMQIGLTMAGCIVFCFFIGLYLDKWLGTRGIFVTLFTILGIVGGAVTVYRQISETLKTPPENKKDPSNGSR